MNNFKTEIEKLEKEIKMLQNMFVDKNRFEPIRAYPYTIKLKSAQLKALTQAKQMVKSAIDEVFDRELSIKRNRQVGALLDYLKDELKAKLGVQDEK